MRLSNCILAATLAVVMLTAVPAAGHTDPPRVPPGRTGVGDSILLSVKPDLRALGWTSVHGVVGRQFDEGIKVVRWLAAAGTLTKRVIVELGTNGSISGTACEQLIWNAGPQRWLFLVTNKVPRSWQDANNRLLNACANAHPKVDVIHWWSYSHRHPRWFAPDHYHLSELGRAEFTTFVNGSIDAIVEASKGGRPLR